MDNTIMDRSKASYEAPILNQIPDGEYVSEANRTAEDDEAFIYDADSNLRQRKTVCPRQVFDQIYKATLRFFSETEQLQYRQYQLGEKTPQEFYRDCGQYLKRNFKEMNTEDNHDFLIMMDRINTAVFGYDVLQPLIDNPDTSDIKICGPFDIRVRVKGKAYKSNATFLNEKDMYRFISSLSLRNKVDINEHPFVTFTDSHDKNYILRFVVSSPIISASGLPLMHIRKVPKTKPDFDELIRRGMLTENVKRYLIDKAKTSRGIVFAGPPGCVDRNTEFFNGTEWKSIADYVKGDKVLQFDTKTNEASLVEPLAYIKKPCNEMYHFETKYGINQTLSKEHRVLFAYKIRENGKKKWEEKLSEISAEELAQLQNSGHFYGGFKTDFCYNGAGIPLTNAELKLMLAVICDGTFHKNSDACIVNFKKERKRKALQDILQEWGGEYTEHQRKNGYTVFRFYPPRREKEFSSDWYQCSKEQLQLICDNILQWDGSIKKNGRRSFTTTSKRTADFVQFAFSACGCRASISKSNREGTPYQTNGKTYIRRRESYTVILSNRTVVGMAWHNDGRENNVKLIPVTPEDGYKYCFTVPTHALVLRRENNIFITGNSGKSTALNAFIEFIPKTRECLVLQENDELHTKQSGFMFKHVTHGFQGEPVVTLEDLGKMALVEGCNEFIIGEVKGGEMRYAMTLLNAGGYAALTVHSTNAYETLDKMADLVKYGSSYTFDEARRMLKTFDTVVYMEGYKVREILEVDGYDDETKQYKYINIYRFMSSKEEDSGEDSGEEQ